MQHLVIVTTGGTIDKIYFDDKSTFQIGAPQIGEILEALGVAFSFDVVPVMRKEALALGFSVMTHPPELASLAPVVDRATTTAVGNPSTAENSCGMLSFTRTTTQ